MNRERVKLWLAALRSGDYTQAAGRLRSVNNTRANHCCLGVMCDLYRKETGLGEWVKGTFYIGDYLSSSLPLPQVMEWMGLQGNDIPISLTTLAEVKGKKWTEELFVSIHGPHLPIAKDYYIMISKINDNGATFSEIADILEKTLLGEEPCVS